MKIKFKKALSEKLKDMGLTEKAIDDLVEIGCEGLKDDASDEDINQKVDLLVPYAKIMQGEITRKTRKTTTHNQTEPPKDGEVEGEDARIAAIIAKQLAPLTETVNSLKAENEALKAEKAKGERSALIAEKAKKLGIPDFLLKNLVASDGDTSKFEAGIWYREGGAGKNGGFGVHIFSAVPGLDDPMIEQLLVRRRRGSSAGRAR